MPDNELKARLDFSSAVAARARSLVAEEAVRFAAAFAVGAGSSAEAAKTPVGVSDTVAVLCRLLGRQARLAAVGARICVKKSHR